MTSTTKWTKLLGGNGNDNWGSGNVNVKTLLTSGKSKITLAG